MKKYGLVLGTAVLAALCAVYAGVSWYLGLSAAERARQEKAAEIYMTDFDGITTLSYDNGGDTLSFTKEGETWYYDGDRDFPLQQSRIAAIENTVKKLKAVRRLEGGDGASAYGLEPPVRRVEAGTASGERLAILIGNSTETGDYYAVVEGEVTPCLIGSALFDQTEAGLEDLIALEEFPAVLGTGIQEITVEKDGNVERYVKKKAEDEGSTAWYADSADSEENKISDRDPRHSNLNVLADSLASLRVERCASYKVTEEELEKYGLKAPAAVLGYTYEEGGEEKSFSLSVGGLNDDETCYYVRSGDSGMINEVSRESLDKCLNLGAGQPKPAGENEVME